MHADKETIVRRIRSAQTWERADWWMRLKGWNEAKEARGPVKTEDYLPIVLGFVKLFFTVLPVGILLFISWRSYKIMFCVVLGISLPLGLGVGHLLDYLIGRYIVTEK